MEVEVPVARFDPAARGRLEEDGSVEGIRCKVGRGVFGWCRDQFVGWKGCSLDGEGSRGGGRGGEAETRRAPAVQGSPELLTLHQILSHPS